MVLEVQNIPERRQLFAFTSVSWMVIRTDVSFTSLVPRDATLELDHWVVECVEKSAIDLVSWMFLIMRNRQATWAIRKSPAEGVCFDRQTDNRGRLTACNWAYHEMASRNQERLSHHSAFFIGFGFSRYWTQSAKGLPCSEAVGVWSMQGNDNKPTKAWWVNWLIIAGTVIVIMVLSWD